MTVYVDDMRAPFGRMIMCHMIADSRDELLAMADLIGVSRRWLQKAGTIYEHFDISRAKRNLAVRAGAVEITKRDLVKLCLARRTPPRAPQVGRCRADAPHKWDAGMTAPAALKARDYGTLWKRSMAEAVEAHGAACDALWAELERQVVVADGGVPVLDHPSVKARKLARHMRTQIVATVQQALSDALDDMEEGVFDDDP